MSGTQPKPFEDHFSPIAGGYAEFRPVYPAALVDFLARVAPTEAPVWEAGCGSGQLSLPLAERFQRIVATDASPDQLARAAPHRHIEYRCARAESSPLPEAVVGLCVSAQAAHWFDLPAYYAEVRRTARPDGIVALICYGIHGVDEALDPLIRRFYTRQLDGYWGPERRHVESGFQTLSFPFAELPTPEIEMRMDWSLDRMIGYIETWSAVRSMLQREGRAPIDAFFRDLARAWGPPLNVKTVCWPLSLRLGRVRGDRANR